ncbi:MAG: hypothetical protein K6C05_00775 [Anaerovibrio sp.]|uniref:hypothetical protein n=1 Tax=Anaerovibrio sp. TaxID=1872532 RepID=UPI0025FBBB45|nr:hypothetical protein [Anaerovibrio sp.]MCR5175362.1 hypothetical protein [Anaerovibrio sp.]
MKKIAFFFVFVACIILFSPSQRCAAEDIWVDHWEDVGYDIYVMNDTIVKGHNADYISFMVTVKQVEDDTLTNVLVCQFQKWPGDAWRMRNSESEGTNFSAVACHDPIYEYCMNRLGWEYTTDNGLYY